MKIKNVSSKSLILNIFTVSGGSCNHYISMDPGQEHEFFDVDVEKSFDVLNMICSGCLTVIGTQEPYEAETGVCVGGYFTELKDTPDSYCGAAGKAVVVNACACGLDYATFSGSDEKVAYCTGDCPGYLINKFCGGSNITLNVCGSTNKYISIDATVPADTNDKVGICGGDCPGYLNTKICAGPNVTFNTCGTTDKCIQITTAAPGACAFTGLSDVPASYGACCGCLVAVNAGGCGLEFVSTPVIPTDWSRCGCGYLYPTCASDYISSASLVSTCGLTVSGAPICSCGQNIITDSSICGVTYYTGSTAGVCGSYMSVDCMCVYVCNGLIICINDES